MEIEGSLVPRELHPFGESMPDFIEYVGEEASCRSCGMPILWCRTRNQKRIPMDLTAGPKDGKMISHFAICPNAKRHRKPRTKEKAHEDPEGSR